MDIKEAWEIGNTLMGHIAMVPKAYDLRSQTICPLISIFSQVKKHKSMDHTMIRAQTNIMSTYNLFTFCCTVGKYVPFTTVYEENIFLLMVANIYILVLNFFILT